MVSLTARRPLASLPTEETPTELLLACHERIRRFSELAVKLATVEAPPAERADAARAVLRYFTVAMRFHVQDEDLSLAPRLPDLTVPTARMAEEHRAIDQLLEELIPGWQALARDPTSGASGQLRSAVLLRAAFDGHLAHEERLVFPAVAQLDPRIQATIREEMRQRRT